MRHVTKGLARRGFLAGILAAPLLASCTGPTRIAIGQRETYTPPPPGIDEIYRTELLTSVTDLAGILETARPHEDFPSFLTSAIATHQRALRTGAEQEKIASAEANRTEKGGSAHESAAVGTQAPVERAMLDAARGLAALRDLYAHATIQVSGDFADLCAAGSAWTEWAALRLTRVAKAAAVAGVSAPKPFTDMEPSREVPAIDPPEAAETHLIETPLERAQTDENFAAYALEVAATRVKLISVRRTSRRLTSTPHALRRSARSPSTLDCPWLLARRGTPCLARSMRKGPRTYASKSPLARSPMRSNSRGWHP